MEIIDSMSWFVSFLVGTAAGVLSAFGIGGGSLLLVYLTVFAGVPQQTAQGTNLLYFLPTAGAALSAHRKNGLLDSCTILPAILAGLFTAAGAAWLSNGLDTSLLRRLFGLFLLYIGVTQLFEHDKAKTHPASDFDTGGMRE